MLEDNGDPDAVENTGNRDNACNTSSRVSSLGFRPGVVYVNPDADNEISVVDSDGKVDSWYLDGSLDNIPVQSENKRIAPLPSVLADQDTVGEKV